MFTLVLNVAKCHDLGKVKLEQVGQQSSPTQPSGNWRAPCVLFC